MRPLQTVELRANAIRRPPGRQAALACRIARQMASGTAGTGRGCHHSGHAARHDAGTAVSVSMTNAGFRWRALCGAMALGCVVLSAPARAQGESETIDQALCRMIEGAAA